jgi:uncharacterized protein (TIGR03067 family)
MPATPDTHPRRDQLSAFALGKLESADVDAVESHLAECDTCCDALRQLKEDTFVGLVRQSQDKSEAGDATLALGIAMAPAPTPGERTESDAAVASDIPADLANHARYRIVDLLGTGGMGAVYKAEHRLMQRLVALKVINPKFTRSKQAVERFRREAQAAARLDHPHIVRAHDAEQAGDLHFLVMEYVLGTDLGKVLEERGPLPVAEACDSIRQAAVGLQHAHESGMVHRDIKPQNLMLSQTREPGGGVGSIVKILDFGLASLTTEAAPDPGADHQISVDSQKSGLTQAGALMGTPDYMAPEQGRNASSADIRSDIYSLGCTLYTLLAGKVPFPGGTAIDKILAHSTRPVPPLGDVRSDAPAALAKVLDKMMAKDPADRYQTPAEVAGALSSIRAQLPQRPGRPGRRTLVGTLAAAVLLLLSGIIYVVTDNGTLKIDCKVDAKVTVFKDGQQIEIFDQTSTAVVKRYPTGDYEVKVDMGPNLQFEITPESARRPGTATEFTMRRGGEVVLQVTRMKQEAAKPNVNLPPAAEDQTGWTKLFNGKDLTGWREVYDTAKHRSAPWDIVDGVLILKGDEKNRGYLRTDKQYREFHLRFDFKPTAFAPFDVQRNSAIMWGVQGPDDKEKAAAAQFQGSASAPLAVRWELAQGKTAEGKDSRPACTVFWEEKEIDLGIPWTTIHGGDSPPDGWNRAEVIATAGALELRVNGLNEIVQGYRPIQGHIGVLAHIQGLHLRNIEIKDLSSAESSAPASFTNNLGMKFVLVPKGKAWLGGGHNEGLSKDAWRGKTVDLKDDFYLGAYEVTQDEWQKVMGTNPSHFSRGGKGSDAVKHLTDSDLKRFPVENVSWLECQEFVTRLNEALKENGWVYRLPTEPEWEYACRGGPLLPKKEMGYNFYLDRPRNQLQQANFAGAGLMRPTTVGSFPPNALGLHDMHGNVWEWCANKLRSDEKDPKPGTRVARGGGWNEAAENCSATVRWTGQASERDTNHGLRLARVPVSSRDESKPGQPLNKNKDTDEAKLQGVWKSLSVTAVHTELTFDGDRFVLKRIPKGPDPMPAKIKAEVSGVFQLDTAADPRRFKVVDPKSHRALLLGIYLLNGNSLSLCLNVRPTEDGSDEYPRRFTAEPGVGGEFHVLKKFDAREEAATKAAQSYLKLVEDGDYGRCWEESAELVRQRLSKDEFLEIFEKSIKPLGKPLSRRLHHRQLDPPLPMTPKGEYIDVEFHTMVRGTSKNVNSDGSTEVVELVTTMLDKDGQWRVAGYLIIPRSSKAFNPTLNRAGFRPSDGIFWHRTLAAEQQAILGGWQPVSAEAFGHPVPKALIDLMQSRVIFTPDKLTAKVNLDKMPLPEMLKTLMKGFEGKEGALLPGELDKVFDTGSVEAVYTFDPTKTPKTINISYLSPIRKTLLGIYSLEGDTLKLCVAVDPDKAEQRPTEFAAKSGQVYAILKRISPDDWVSLFDGKELTGWNPFPENRSKWKIDDGVLRVASGAGLLLSKKSYGDFHLRAETRIRLPANPDEPGGAWGLMFRTGWGSSGISAFSSPSEGFGAEFHGHWPKNNGDGSKNIEIRFVKAAGRITNEVMSSKEANVKLNDWTPMEIIVQDGRVDIKIADAHLSGGRIPAPLPSGPIHLFVPNTATAPVEFRKIEIKELPVTTP